jgi:hypothetical protein
VEHKGTRFLVTNTDSYDWRDCDFELNTDFRWKSAHVPAGHTIEIPSAQFAKSDGTRFNWLAMKPMQLYIYCRQAPTSTRSTLHGWK